MRRREFLSVVGGAVAALPLAARAQQRVRRVGVLMNGAATEALPQSFVATFIQGLRQLGWIEGQNLLLDLRWMAGDAQLARIYAAQLIGLAPDVILAASTINLEMVRQATGTIPVVFVQVSDPVMQGFVASLAKPGGNITGFSATAFSVGGKWLELLKEIEPRLARAAVMFNPETSPQSQFFMRSIEAAASSLGVLPVVIPVRSNADIEAGFGRFAHDQTSGIILTTDSFTNSRQQLIADLATRHRVPAIGSQPEFAKSGGLMSYGVIINTMDQFGQAAGYVDRILKGTKPADLPVQGADKYRLVLNFRTAKMLGLTVPQSLLASIDEVIE